MNTHQVIPAVGTLATIVAAVYMVVVQLNGQTTAPIGDFTNAAPAEVRDAPPAEQEVEVSIRNVTPGVAFTFVIDGINLGSATADKRGRAEIELDVRMPGTSPSR